MRDESVARSVATDRNDFKIEDAFEELMDLTNALNSCLPNEFSFIHFVR